MSEISQKKDWHASIGMRAGYEKLLGALGTADFGATVRDCVLSLTGQARRIYLFEATGPANTTLQYFSGEPGLEELFPAYRRFYLRLDPLFDAYRAAPKVSDVTIQRVRPGNIVSPEFRRRVFEEAGIVERISIIQRGTDAWRGINVARHCSEGCFSDEEAESLVELALLVLPMLPVNRQRQVQAHPLSVAQLESRFESRFEILTPRERQVCARAAAGMSVAATADDLGIAPSSVLTYRQRAYQRLKVASPVELRTLITH